MKYNLFVPSQAVGASLVYFDLFNASGSSLDLYIESVKPVVSGAVAVAGTLAVDLFLTRTTAVGTGGTAATTEGTSLTAATICGVDHSQPVQHNITARLTPAGGATAGAVLSQASVFSEETNSGAYTPQEMVKGGPIKVPEGKGIRVVQGGVGSVGNIGFDVVFCVRPKV